MPTLSEIDLQRESARLVDREVQCCLSSLVATLASGYGVLGSYDLRGVLNHVAKSEMESAHFALRDLAEQAAGLASPVDDYEEAATQATLGWTPGQARSAEDLCREHDIEPYQREVFEHWAVSSFLADKLAARGEKVDRDFANLTVWARTTTGQAISMDGVIRAITQEIFK